MRNLTRFGALLVLATMSVSQLQAWDLDDSVIAPQIQVAVAQYRRALAEYEQLQTKLRTGGATEGEIADYPSVKYYVEATLNPAERQLQNICAKYEADYGAANLKKFAKRYQFEDLLKR